MVVAAEQPDSSKSVSVKFRLLSFLAIVCCLVNVAWSQVSGVGGKRAIDVASLNLYVGADLTPVTALDPSDPNYGQKLLAGVATVYGHLIASNFPKRADALAQQIVERSPDLVGLQEVTLLRRQSPGDSLIGGTTPATHVELDYLEILLAALARHGGHYALAALVQDADVEAPLVTGPNSFDDLRLTDRDAILVRTDLPPGQLRISNPQGANYLARIPLPSGITVTRGWTSVDVFVRGRSFRFINTHVEDILPPSFPDIQRFQTLELLGGPANTKLPVILVGDFNADANGNYSPEIYPLLINQGGFTDAWSVVHPGDPGLTWGHDDLLSDPSVHFVFRIDFVLYRDSQFQATDAEILDPLIGAAPPLWFSDHAGLFATLAIN